MEDSKTIGHTEEYISGVHIDTSFVMEPGDPYGDPTDSYSIEVKSASIFQKSIIFSSFEEMEEFSKHLADYVNRHRK